MLSAKTLLFPSSSPLHPVRFIVLIPYHIFFNSKPLGRDSVGLMHSATTLIVPGSSLPPPIWPDFLIACHIFLYHPPPPPNFLKRYDMSIFFVPQLLETDSPVAERSAAVQAIRVRFRAVSTMCFAQHWWYGGADIGRLDF